MKGCAAVNGAWISVPAEFDDPKEDDFRYSLVVGAPGNVRQRVIVPDVKLIVQRSAEHDADEIASEKWQNEELSHGAHVDLLLLRHVRFQLNFHSLETRVGLHISDPTRQEVDNCAQMQHEKSNVKIAIDEDVLGQKSPIDGPLEEKDSGQVKGAFQVSNWIRQQERKSKDQL